MNKEILCDTCKSGTTIKGARRAPDLTCRTKTKREQVVIRHCAIIGDELTFDVFECSGHEIDPGKVGGEESANILGRKRSSNVGESSRAS